MYSFQQSSVKFEDKYTTPVRYFILKATTSLIALEGASFSLSCVMVCQDDAMGEFDLKELVKPRF